MTKPRRRVGLSTTVAIVLIVGVGAFIAGSRSSDIAGLFTGHKAAQALDFSGVQAVYNQLAGQFDGKLDAASLISGAKKGLVEAAGDPYTVYFTDTEAKQFLSDLDGTFSGIGAELAKKNGNLVVTSTLDNSPARQTGLLANDVITKVNDKDATGWPIDQAVGTIRGPKGTTVKLDIVRGQDLKQFSITRADLTDPSVKSEILPQNIGYLRISRFASDTTNLAQKAAQQFKDKKVKGVILDVRGDGGGYLTSAQDVASLWLPSGDEIVQERENAVVKDTLRAQGGNVLAGVPTIVLIDSGSASASEITAGALHDHNAAKLVGEKSFGKGSVQQIVDVPGGQLKVTVAKWYTPSGHNISGQGISPDVVVANSVADISAGTDVQKDKAIQLLTNQ